MKAIRILILLFFITSFTFAQALPKIDNNTQLRLKCSCHAPAALYIVEYKTRQFHLDSLGFKKMDTNGIESLKVIKGDEAIKAYGDEAKHGVVIIALKNRKAFKDIKKYLKVA